MKKAYLSHNIFIALLTFLFMQCATLSTYAQLQQEGKYGFTIPTKDSP